MPAPLSLPWLRFSDHYLSSLWFIPACVSVLAYLVSRATLAIDGRVELERFPGILLPGDVETMTTVAGTATAAMLTFLAVVFSTTLVAVQLAGSQYSPRVVRVFVRSRVTQASLAVFLATFIVSLNTLVGTRRGPRDQLPVLTISLMYVLLLATVAMFVVFFHRIVRLLRVQYLFLSITREAHGVLSTDYPPETSYLASGRPTPDPTPHQLRHDGRPGVVQAVDVAALAASAAAAGPDTWVELRVAVGEQLGHRTLLAEVHHDPDNRIGDLERHLLVGGERTQLQDPAFGFRQLVDAASRALSPAINDPTTAVQAIHRMADLLARVAARPDPTGWYVDASGAVRVRLKEDDFERLALLAFTEVVRYGADSPQVVRCLRAVYRSLGEQVSVPHRHVMVSLTTQLDAAVAEVMPAAFREISDRVDPLGLG